MIDTLSEHGGSSIEGSLHSQLVDPELEIRSGSNGEHETTIGRNFNKSMDFGRHTVSSPRRGSKKPTSSHSNDRSKDGSAEAYGDSYATMGDSFMGESFANLGDQSFAFGNSSQNGFDYSDNEYDNCLEILARVNITNRTDLTTVLDLEEEDEDEIATTSGSESKDEAAATDHLE
jgi:hypothetical protein